ncbi:MAG: DNA adenine methylase [Azoarcus sp.]|jgi:DNA adenine methylase|nr:DNA adenine methylase [Azoarcus sp.]
MEIDRAVPRSVLRYFGGKWALAPWIVGNMPEHRVYVEPFSGAASVLLRKPRSKIEVYNDLDDEIVGVFRVLQNPALCQRLIRLLKRTPYARKEFERAFEAAVDPIIRAQRAIVRAYMAFHHSALFDPKKTTFADARHRHGGYSKAHEWSTYPRHLARVCQRLKGVLIEHRDALEVIKVQDTDDALFFVDPPYLPSTRDKGTGYRHELSEAKHVRLLTLLRSLKGRVMVCGYPSELYDGMLQGWQRLARKHYAASQGMRVRTEVLWISPR